MATVVQLHSSAPTWEAPDLSLLSKSVAPPPAFPRALLGEFWSDWCDATATAACAPFDYVAAGLLTVGGACLGNSRIAQFGAWKEPPVVWMVLVGDPSTNKSPALDSLTSMLRDLNQIAPSTEFVLNDATPRAAAESAQVSPKGNLLLRDELAGWWKTFGQPGGEQFWLQAFGARPHMLRRANKERIDIPRLAISVLGGTQPDMIRALVDSPNTGFASRLLYAVPEFKGGFRLAEPIEDALAFQALGRLWELPASTSPQACHVAHEARDDHEAWVNNMIARGSAMGGLHEQWLGKQRGMALRLALISEHLTWAAESPLAAPPPREISEAALGAARDFIESYAEPMAQRALAATAVPDEVRAAKALLSILRRAGVERFNAARVRRSELGPAGELRHASVMLSACETLEAACLIRDVGVRAGSTAGRKPQDYAVNPALLRA